MKKGTEDIASVKKLKEASTWLGPASLLAVLAVFALAVGWVTYSLRGDIRSQFLDGDNRVLSLLLQNQIDRVQGSEDLFLLDGELGELDLWSVLLESATVSGVFGVQLYSVDGMSLFASVDSDVTREGNALALADAKRGRSSTLYKDKVWLSSLMDVGFEADNQIPLLDIYVPLRSPTSGEGLGVARFLMDGYELAEKFRVLDRRLLAQSSLVFGLGSCLIVGLFWTAWNRLQRARVRVLRQAERLKRANQELASLARSSAVGSVTAHLMHALKNPLAGLQQVVGGSGAGLSTLDAEDLKGAQDATRRMQRMVQEVVGLLQDANSDSEYEVSLDEFVEEVRNRFAADAKEQGILFFCESVGSSNIDSYRTNIALMIVTNLVRNAFDAMNAGGRVSLVVEVMGDELHVRVKDTGPGIPAEQMDKLFMPQRSGKSGGAGIGLTISHQLARHLGGDLRYVDTWEQGAVFEFSMPLDEGGTVKMEEEEEDF